LEDEGCFGGWSTGVPREGAPALFCDCWDLGACALGDCEPALPFPWGAAPRPFCLFNNDSF
jgi:hypothetical protein